MTDEQYLKFSAMVRPWFNKHFTSEDFRHACLVYIQEGCTTDKEFRTIVNRLAQRNKRKHYREIGYDEKKKKYKGTSFQNSRTLYHLDKDYSEFLLDEDTHNSWLSSERENLYREEEEIKRCENETYYHNKLEELHD